MPYPVAMQGVRHLRHVNTLKQQQPRFRLVAALPPYTKSYCYFRLVDLLIGSSDRIFWLLLIESWAPRDFYLVCDEIVSADSSALIRYST